MRAFTVGVLLAGSLPGLAQYPESRYLWGLPITVLVKPNKTGGPDNINNVDYRDRGGFSETAHLENAIITIAGESSYNASLIPIYALQPADLVVDQTFLELAERPLPEAGEWSVAELALMRKAVNYWNHCGANYFLEFQENAWSDNYTRIDVSISEFIYPYSIIKIVTPIEDDLGVGVWPRGGVMGSLIAPISQFINTGAFRERQWFLGHILINGTGAYNNQTLPLDLALDPDDPFEAQTQPSDLDDGTFRMSLTNLLIHEIGHYLGLGHENLVFDAKESEGYDLISTLSAAFTAVVNPSMTTPRNAPPTALAFFRQSDGDWLQLTQSTETVGSLVLNHWTYQPSAAPATSNPLWNFAVHALYAAQVPDLAGLEYRSNNTSYQQIGSTDLLECVKLPTSMAPNCTDVTALTVPPEFSPSCYSVETLFSTFPVLGNQGDEP